MSRRRQPQGIDQGKLPPGAWDEEKGAERAVLGAILLDARCVEQLDGLPASAFYGAGHATIYRAMLALRGRGEPVDVITLNRELAAQGQLEQAGGSAYLVGLTEIVPTAANASFYAALVLDGAARRQAADAGQCLVDGAYDRSRPLPDTLAAAHDALRGIHTEGQREGGPMLRTMSDVEAQDVDFVWPPYLPRGKLTLLSGDPSAGKTWLALAIAAAVSRGRGLLGQDGRPLPPRPPGRVLYCTAEDGLADTIRPRLDLLGADVSRVIALEGRRTAQGEVAPLRFADLDVIEAALKQTCAELMVLDPLQAFMGADVDLHRANETRSVMAPLGALAERLGVAVLIVRHLSKGGTGRALHRGLGSIDLTAVARSELFAGTDASGEQRAMAHIKSSCAAKGTTLGYTLREPDGFAWAGLSSMTVGDMLAPEEPEDSETRSSAEEFLAEVLADGPRETRELKRLAGDRGLAWRSVERARGKLGVVSEPNRKAGKVIGWCLRLSNPTPPATQPDRQTPKWRCGGVEPNSRPDNGRTTPPPNRVGGVVEGYTESPDEDASGWADEH